MSTYAAPALPRPAPFRPSATPWHAGRSRLILDLDGTLIREHEPIDGAHALLQAFRGRFAIVSNNSTHTARQLARRLRGMGLPVRAADLVLAGEQMVEYLRGHHAQARILMYASAALRRHAAARGCRLVERDAHIVALALDKRFGYAALADAAHELARGARLVVSNPDLTHPGPDGRQVPETGALLQAVRACAGVASWHMVGKPEPAMFEEGLRRLGGAPHDTLVIGDNPLTDGAGAARAGLPCLLLGPDAGAAAATPAQLLALDDAPLSSA
ncbi:HAD-IIA family hydrolase [Bordetella petrii]|uniref:HAD-IA family hydrolase n=1 Tax=Bordetella petrii TaxID=94624 RepID=A0ABT7W0Z5_9BORD|nr:HAD-IA family hydrolase [Bordetella petrii]MDM9558869.1 HAD-IA family hydrolase [Bordetella petrii]